MSTNDEFNNFLKKLSFIHNEVTTPISNMLANSQIIDMSLNEETVDSEYVKDYVKTVTENCSILERTINNIVSYCYPECNNYNLIKISDFAEKFSEAVGSYAEKYDFNFNYDLNTKDDEFYLPVSLIEKMLLNLIVNSVQYNSKNQKKVSLSVTQNDKTLIFTVSDNGDGIAPENLSKVTDIMFRENSSKYYGAGLGLSFIKSATESLGGTLEIKSTIKTGTEVSFSIPEKTQIQLKSSNFEYKPYSSHFRTEFCALLNKRN